ncbi:Leucine-responsive regulatory protein [Anaerohalosphaera lusitana]|uniref:Leucine-responsive regulatory protein n=1 Tax=Anaerohalosphaera lusitana TaxID=1936003 RepID=A0A1U9NHA2_9BACT|nr:Lrp/AsnC family transcriptional regulator [Anaerohalosphaera lusitana]AQT67147.1 Leucine-responsive regulatory protein [Anaerohalosphaera lusitana]
MQPDKTDWQIIEILSKQHIPNNQIARQLGVSEGTVRRRIKALQDAGVMRVRALLDPDVLKDKQLAIILASVKESKLLKEKATEVSKLQNVNSVAIISGAYDLLIEVIVSSNRGMITFLTEQLSTVKGIEKTETHVVMKSYGKYI